MHRQRALEAHAPFRIKLRVHLKFQLNSQNALILSLQNGVKQQEEAYKITEKYLFVISLKLQCMILLINYIFYYNLIYN